MTVYDDEIDLRPYILALFRHWWQIGLIVVILSASAYLYTNRQPRIYKATATILLTRTRSNLTLAEQFPTVSEPVDTRSRMDALLSITKSDTLAVETLNLVGDMLPEENRNIEAIKNRVSITNQGDTILVSATAQEPETAAKIANTWALQAVQDINLAYSGEQPLAELEDQMKTARGDYQAVQADLETFIQTNRISLLQKQQDEAQILLSSLSGDRAWKISYYTNRMQSMENLLIQAEALKKQIQDGINSNSGGLGDALAVLRVRATALGISEVNLHTSSYASPSSNSNQPLTLNLQVNDLNALLDDPANYASDLDTVIQLANDEGIKAQDALDELTQQVLQESTDPNIESAAATIQNIATELEKQNAQQKELTSQRDLAWEAYQAMAEKVTEIKNTAQTDNQVTLASQAIAPQKPSSSNTLRNTIAAGAIGLILGCLFFLSLQWWQSANFSSVTNHQNTTKDAQKG
jgi:uncharacterized protein involved in exopolysaccharide biosynthesis